MEKLLDVDFHKKLSKYISPAAANGCLSAGKITLRHIFKDNEEYFSLIHRWLQEPNVFDGFLFDGDVVLRDRIFVDFLNYASLGQSSESFMIMSGEEPVGLLILVISFRHRSCEVGHMIVGNKFRGNGYNGDALWGIVKYAFSYLNMNRISMEVYSTNKSSIRSVEKTGLFKLESIKQKARMRNGKSIDVNYYVCLRPYWPKIAER